MDGTKETEILGDCKGKPKRAETIIEVGHVGAWKSEVVQLKEQLKEHQGTGCLPL